MNGFVVGLTGGIGSGKSAAAERFASLGAAVVDTDAIAHELTGVNGAALPALRAAFGNDIAAADGSLDRAAMRARVFADARARASLESILHPPIRAEALRRCAAAFAAAADYVVLVVPLLVESGGYREHVSRIAVVDCSEATQLVRVMQRSALTAAEAQRIMTTQASRAQRLAAADDVIDNDGDIDNLWRQVDALHARYRQMTDIYARR